MLIASDGSIFNERLRALRWRKGSGAMRTQLLEDLALRICPKRVVWYEVEAPASLATSVP